MARSAPPLAPVPVRKSCPTVISGLGRNASASQAAFGDLMPLPRRALPALAATLAAARHPVNAQPLASLPAGTVRIVVPYNPGGITDILARALAQPMTTLLGNTVVVENRAGANGSIGTTVVARAAPDGLTLLLGVTDTHAVNPAAMRNLPYDAERDFEPVTLITHVPLALAVGPTQRDVRDLRGFNHVLFCEP